MSNSLKVMEDKPWYHKGLRFKCTGCGKCCGGSPGAVWLSKQDVERISKHLNLKESEFLEKYTHRIDGRLSLKEKENYDCILLVNNQCSIYSIKPRQCTTYPFWNHILASKENWAEAKNFCEGINEEAPLISFEEIQKNL